MTDRQLKYLQALSRRRRALSGRELEALSSDFDVSSRDLQILLSSARRYLASKDLMKTSWEELQVNLKNQVYSAFHDKSVLLLFLPLLRDRYRKDKLKLVFDMLVLVAKQAGALGATEEELAEFSTLVASSTGSGSRRWIWGFVALLLILAFLFYQRAWDWWGWLSMSADTSGNVYLGSRGQALQEEPLGSSRSLALNVSVAGYNDLPLRIDRSSVIVFPESYLYDVRAGIVLPRSVGSYRYKVSVYDIAQRELQSFTEEKHEPTLGLWTQDTVLPLEFQSFHLGRPSGTPYSIDWEIEELTVSENQENLGGDALEIVTHDSKIASLSGSIVKVDWQSFFGIWRGHFVLELAHLGGSVVRSLGGQFSILDKAGDIVTSFEVSLINPNHSVALAMGEIRRFFISKDFLQAFIQDLPKRAYGYRWEIY